MYLHLIIVINIWTVESQSGHCNQYLDSGISLWLEWNMHVCVHWMDQYLVEVFVCYSWARWEWQYPHEPAPVPTSSALTAPPT